MTDPLVDKTEDMGMVLLGGRVLVGMEVGDRLAELLGDTDDPVPLVPLAVTVFGLDG